MSFSKPMDAKTNNLVSTDIEVEVTSSRERRSSNYSTATMPHSGISQQISKEEESDEDMFTVPDVETQSIPTGFATNNSTTDISIGSEVQSQSGFPVKRRRGRNPVDKEYRRLKRLLRNRVSAQQARERKKVYVNELESAEKELIDRNARLEEQISTLINENSMLRKVLLNNRPKADEHVETKDKHLGSN